MPIKKVLKFNGKKVVGWVPDPKRKDIAEKRFKRLVEKAVDRRMATGKRASA